ncbi:complex I NDUFA9 subunit family protein [Nitrosovibrio tenuis]|uniref:NADH dehydrogenase n=1 Tax=Nitrosovibrio tenuis TaxID=1233 RepID=A0A1H7G6S3_9PROT|nr:complex I NDUFA9 subunit family protein [Nitrosovibrio tenuis]SEK33818.1 NADH dehydrogenase [Nitrosovibrio tenuis]
MAIRNVCIFGGSGFVGGHLANLLTAQDINLCIPTRQRERAKELLVLPTADVMQANVYDDAELDRVLSGVDAVINLVGTIKGDFNAAHVELPRKIVAACQRNGIARLLHMSALNAGPGQPSAYLRSKGEGERIVMSSGLDATVFKPSVIFGPGDSSLSLFARLGRLPVLPLASPEAKFQPVFVEDVVQAFAGSLDAPHTIGHSYNLCGPKCYSLRQLFEYAAHVAGHKPVIIGLNEPLSYLQALVLEFLPGKLMTRDNYYSMKVDNICDCDGPGNLTKVWGIQSIAIEEVAPYYLAHRMPRVRYDDFRQRAGR